MRSRAPRLSLAAALVALPLMLASTAKQPEVYIDVSRPSQVRELAFAVRGKIMDVTVEPGDSIEVGDELMKLDDAVQLATIDLAKAQYENDTRLQLARINLDYAKKELEIVQESSAAGGANQQDLREARLAVDRAEVELRAAELEQEERRITLEREQARLNEMRIISTIEGDVIDVAKREGETVDEQTPVLTVVQVDPLYIDVSVPVPVARDLEPGQSARVEWVDLVSEEPAEGSVLFISKAGDASVRGEVRVRVEVPNPSRLPSGAHARVTF